MFDTGADLKSCLCPIITRIKIWRDVRYLPLASFRAAFGSILMLVADTDSEMRLDTKCSIEPKCLVGPDIRYHCRAFYVFWGKNNPKNNNIDPTITQAYPKEHCKSFGRPHGAFLGPCHKFHQPLVVFDV
jgi:hypothetical protein